MLGRVVEFVDPRTNPGYADAGGGPGAGQADDLAGRRGHHPPPAWRPTPVPLRAGPHTAFLPSARCDEFESLRGFRRGCPEDSSCVPVCVGAACFLATA